MNATDDPFRPLDQRAAAAATDVHARAAARPVPAFDPHRADVTPLPASRPVGRGRALAVAAVVLAIAAIAGLLVSQSGDDDSDKAKVITTDPRPFVLTRPPTGFALTGAGEVTAENSRAAGLDESGRRPVVLFGSSAEDPQLAISVQPAVDGSGADTDGREVVDLGDGREAYRYDGLGLGKHALLVPGDDRSVLFVSPTLDSAALRSLAARAEVGSDGQIDVGAAGLPRGWKEVGRYADLSVLGGSVTTLLDPNGIGRYTAYVSGSGSSSSSNGVDSGLLTVSSTPGDAAHLYAGTVLADTSSTTTVQGHEAVLTTTVMYVNDDDQRVPLRTVAWIEQPGEVVRVSGSGLTDQQLLAAAESAEPIGSAEWKDLVERSQLGDFATDDEAGTKVTVGEGRFTDGSRWRLEAVPSTSSDYPDPDVSLSVAVAEPDDSTSDGGSSTGSQLGGTGARGILATTAVQTGGKTFAGALVGPDVARVELRGPGGELIGELEIHTGGGFRGVATLIAADAASLVTFDAAGQEIDRTDLGLPIGSDEAEGDDGTGTATTVVSSSSSDSGSGSSSSSSSGSFSTSGSRIDSGSSSGSSGGSSAGG